MSLLDIIILIILTYGIIKGILRGFVLQAFSIIGVVIGIYFSIAYVGKVSLWLSQSIDISLTYARPITYFIIFCTVLVVSHLIAKLLDKSVKILLISWLNKLLGALVGGLKYALVLSVFFNIFQAMDKNVKILKQEMKDKSMLYSPVYKVVPKILPFIKTDFLTE